MNRILFCLVLTSMFSAPAWAQKKGPWAGFYDQQTLAYWQTQMPPGIEENFREVIPQYLLPQEKLALANVELHFPLENGEHPMNFYATYEQGRRSVVMPISSLRFFGDLALAYVWLHENGYSTEPVSDYLTMLKWKRPDKWREGAYRPLKVLGIPNSVRSEARVMKKYEQVFETAIFFLLCHELGHHYVWQVLAQEKIAPIVGEGLADYFALEMMRRIGATPIGMTFYFLVLAHLEPNDSDAEYLGTLPPRTHPLTALRLRDVANLLNQNTADFTATGTGGETIRKLVSEINSIADVVNDPDLQALLRRKGFTADPRLLGPRRSER